jgi:hypothetical protein
MPLTVRGVEGAIRLGYYPVGTLRAWIVTRMDDTWSLTATVESLDVFRASQRPLTFVARHKDGRWVWPIQTLQISGGSLTASLGPPER